MSLYSDWHELASAERDEHDNARFWDEYFAAEKELYQRVLEQHENTFSGTYDALADEFGWDKTYFMGFLDGANTSLKEACDLESVEHDTQIALAFDFDRLYYNMLEAKAPWLYEMPEWDAVLSEEKRHEILHGWRASKVFVADKKVGPNDPCPCGSGKKYKKCCGRAAE